MEAAEGQSAALVELPFSWTEKGEEEGQKRIAALLSLVGSCSTIYLQLITEEKKQLEVKELERALIFCYECTMNIDLLRNVIVLPPFSVHGFNPLIDLANLCALVTVISTPSEEIERINVARKEKGYKPLTHYHASQEGQITEKGPSAQKAFATYGEVVLGGTFDRLHAGHKVMLIIAAVLAERRIEIGITAEEMLRNKKHGELLQSFETRRKAVLDVLGAINPHVEIDAFALHDPYGNTLTKASLEVIVASQETEAACQQINEKRKANSVPPLIAYIIGLIKAPSILGEQAKLSSTALREYDSKRAGS